MPKKFRVFIDTSALIAGLNSPTGGAGAILTACFLHQIIPVISPQIIKEMESNIPLKFPKLADAWASFLLIPPEITKTPAIKDIRKAFKILPTSDAPILASALKEKLDALVTWNTKDFLRKEVVEISPFPILTPGEFLNKFLKY